MDTQEEKKTISDVSIVCEFPDIVPLDLSGMPPKRQLEFKIDLISDVSLIPKTSYHLTPPKMQELHTQL